MAELQAKHDVTLHWLPYELRPEPEPLPRMEGPDLERFRGNWERGVAPLAERYGLEMHFPPYKPRSRWAHEAAAFRQARATCSPICPRLPRIASSSRGWSAATTSSDRP